MLKAMLDLGGISMFYKRFIKLVHPINPLWHTLICGCLVGIFFAVEAFSAPLPKVLRADFRHRPPEMVLDEKHNRMTGPVKDILEEAAAKVGYSIEWTARPFARSLYELQVGTVDIVPRTIRTPEREAFIHFLGPISIQERDILFLVKTGEEARIKSYEDLYKVTVGVKRRTVYFERFDGDQALNKVESIDDENMARMFIMGRFDTMAVLDRAAIESVLTKLEYERFSYADFRQQNRIEHYFGMSNKSPHLAIFDALNQALLEMVASGRIKQIYLSYGLTVEGE